MVVLNHELVYENNPSTKNGHIFRSFNAGKIFIKISKNEKDVLIIKSLLNSSILIKINKTKDANSIISISANQGHSFTSIKTNTNTTNNSSYNNAYVLIDLDKSLHFILMDNTPSLSSSNTSSITSLVLKYESISSNLCNTLDAFVSECILGIKYKYKDFYINEDNYSRNHSHSLSEENKCIIINNQEKNTFYNNFNSELSKCRCNPKFDFICAHNFHKYENRCVNYKSEHYNAPHNCEYSYKANNGFELNPETQCIPQSDYNISIHTCPNSLLDMVYRGYRLVSFYISLLLICFCVCAVVLYKKFCSGLFSNSNVPPHVQSFSRIDYLNINSVEMDELKNNNNINTSNSSNDNYMNITTSNNDGDDLIVEEISIDK